MSSSQKGKDIFELLEEDHEKVRGLISKMQESSSGAQATRKSLLEKVKKELIPHMEAEEELFYPWLQERSEEKDHVFEAIEEHQVARRYFEELEDTAADDERWKAKAKVLFELVDHHATEEEEELFSMARKHMEGDTPETMAKEFRELKKKSLDEL